MNIRLKIDNKEKEVCEKFNKIDKLFSFVRDMLWMKWRPVTDKERKCKATD